MSTLFQLPYQRVPMREKYADNKQWFKDNLDALVPYGTATGYEMENWETVERNYRLYNNIILPADIQDECGEMLGNFAMDVAQIDKAVIPYNITYRKIDKLLGEESKRGLNASVYLINEYDIREREDEIRTAIRDSVADRFNWVEMEQRPDIQALSPQQRKELKDQMITSESPEDIDQVGYLSNKQMLGHKLMELGMFREKVKKKRNQGFKDALLSDREVVFVGERHGDAYIEILNPLRCGFIKSPEEDMIHRGIAAWYRVPMYIEDVLDKWGKYLSETDYDKLVDRIQGRDWAKRYGRDHRGSGAGGSTLTQAIQSSGGDDSSTIGKHGNLNSSSQYVWFSYCQWRGSREVGFHTFTNDYGDQELEIVDKEFTIPKDATKVPYIDIEGMKQYRYEWINEYGETESIEYEWISRTYEGFKIDNDIYGMLREMPNQHTSANNPYDSHLTFYGTTYNETNATSISMMGRMRPFQYLYLTIIDKIKELTAKEQGMLSAYDTTQIDPALEDEETGRDALQMQLYYEHTHSAVYYNSLLNRYTGREVAQRPAGFATVPKSNASFIQAYMQLADWCERQIGSASSITPHREGQTAERDSVRNVQSNVVHASDITEHYFQKHNEIWQYAIEGYVSKQRKLFKRQLEYGESFSLNYVLSDSEIKTLEVSREDVEDTDYGIYVSDSGAEAEFLQRLEGYSQALIQNDKVLAEDVAEILEALSLGKSMQTVKRMLKRSSGKRQEEQMQQIEKQNEAVKQQTEMAAMEKDKDHERAKDILAVEHTYDMELEDKKQIGEINKATVVGAGFAKDGDMNNNGQPDILDIRNEVMNQKLKQGDINIKKQNQQLNKEALKIKEQQLKQQAKKPNK